MLLKEVDDGGRREKDRDRERLKGGFCKFGRVHFTSLVGILSVSCRRPFLSRYPSLHIYVEIRMAHSRSTVAHAHEASCEAPTFHLAGYRLSRLSFSSTSLANQAQATISNILLPHNGLPSRQQDACKASPSNGTLLRLRNTDPIRSDSPARGQAVFAVSLRSRTTATTAKATETAASATAVPPGSDATAVGQCDQPSAPDAVPDPEFPARPLW